MRLDDPAKYQSIVDAEWNIIYDKLDKCVKSGAQIVLSRLAIGDLGTQYFADRNIFCAGRVADDDLQRVAKATGARVQTTVNNLDTKVLGTCSRFEEKQVGAERYNLFTGCPQAKTATFVLRGGSEQFIDEAERSLHDAIMIVRRALKHSEVVPGRHRLGATPQWMSLLGFFWATFAANTRLYSPLDTNIVQLWFEIVVWLLLA